MLSLLVLQAHTAGAAFWSKSRPSVDLRYGYHKEYLRVVLEGPHNIITKGKVKHKENEVKVTFDDTDFSVKKKKLPISYSKGKHHMLFKKSNLEKIVVRTLSDPSRLVIDFYEKKTGHEQKKTGSTDKKITNQMNKVKARPVKKEDQKAAGTGPDKPATEKIENVAATKPEQKPSESGHQRAEQKKTGKNEVVKDTLATKKIDDAGEKKLNALMDEINDQGSINPAKNGEKDFVPPHYKKLWTLLESGNYYGLLTALPEYKPEDAPSVAVYHYMYGAASYGAKNYIDAIEHLRLAYIYASPPVLKEKALSLRARTHMDAGFLQESRADYMMLIRDFPLSNQIRKAHLGLANSLSKLGFYSKAVKEYDRAGEDAEVLYSKANALQRLERVKDARIIYAKAKLADGAYPERSAETYYLLGENMRMSGNLATAEKHMSRIASGTYSDSAKISLGLIALKKGNVKESISHFTAGSNSKERKIRISGLFNLALAQITWRQ